MGAAIRTTGSFSKKKVPSDMASTSPVKRNPRKYSRNASGKTTSTSEPADFFLSKGKSLEIIQKLLESCSNQEVSALRKFSDIKLKYRRLVHFEVSGRIHMVS